MVENKVVSHAEWLDARKRHLADEKEFTRARDRLSQARRDLPWELVDKEYVFIGAAGQASLADLFDGRSQLVVYHAMFNPATASASTSWTTDAACFVCSWWMDNFERIAVHLNHHDVSIVAVSLAPYKTIAAYRERMGWTFPYYSSVGTDFNFDYRVSFTPEEMASGKADYNYRTDAVGAASEAPGVSVFLRGDDGKIYHTYSTYARGLDMLNVAYHYLDITPKGRNESGGMWVRRRDEYPD